MNCCLKISDRIGVRDLVAMLGVRGIESEWEAHDVWTVQEGDDCRFEELCERMHRIGGAQFTSALQEVTQVIDGRFAAFDRGAVAPWVEIESIDSSYHLLHADEQLAKEARKRFARIVEVSRPAVPWRRNKSTT